MTMTLVRWCMGRVGQVYRAHSVDDSVLEKNWTDKMGACLYTIFNNISRADILLDLMPNGVIAPPLTGDKTADQPVVLDVLDGGDAVEGVGGGCPKERVIK